MRTAIFPGSFDPFTIGHADIVNRALGLFDHIYIGIGINNVKTATFPLEKRLADITDFYRGNDKVTVCSFSGLAVDFAKEHGAQFILRGVRMVADFEYERNMAQANKQLSGIETILLYTAPQYAHISSSLVRDLHKHNADISAFLPNNQQL
ncbi:MAG: pantetheine-phosphate adenylyltransferase [Paludibacteraceae bacterium]|nr:pantetheine-phosphate adenylyltransferase [Paludibacteraceae bacterium]